MIFFVQTQENPDDDEDELFLWYGWTTKGI